MATEERVAAVREAYRAFAAGSPTAEPLLALCAPDVVVHIAGNHPLSGDYRGIDGVRRYLDALSEATAGRGGFTVTSVLVDDDGDQVLVEGTAFHGDQLFVRTIVHRLRFADGRLVDFADTPFDQAAEDAFWRARVPAQRRTGADRVVPPQVTRWEQQARGAAAGPPPHPA